MNLTPEQQAHLDATKASITGTIESFKRHFEQQFPKLKMMYTFDCEATEATHRQDEGTPQTAEKAE